VAYKGSSAPGVNAGVGFTIRFADSNWKFYTEAPYHYAWSNNVSTTLLRSHLESGSIEGEQKCASLETFLGKGFIVHRFSH